MDPVPYLVSIMMLAWASVLDLQERRVRNRYWVPFIAAAGLLWVPRLDAPDAPIMAVGAVAATALFYAMWRFGFFGGADAKGLMVLAWVWPATPDLLAGRTIPVLDLLINATVVVLALPVGLLLFNAAKGHFALPAMLLGVRMPLGAAEARFVWPLQRIDGGRLRWKYWQRAGTELAPVYAALRRHGVDRVWVTPKVPFMVPLTVGAILSWWGNGVLLAMRALL